MNKKKFYSFLGLCQRAGKLTSGEDSVKYEIKKGKIRLLIIAEDASHNTKESFLLQAQSKKIPYLIVGDKENLGLSIGKGYRALVGIKDKNMAANLIKIYND